MPGGGGLCSVSAQLGDLLNADVWLDPAAALDPESREVRLILREQSCASGRSADDRVEVVGLAEDEQQVAFVLGVRHLEEQLATCPANPDTHFTLRLEHPLGDREIVDASIAEPREVVPRR